jgi:hypothetical protein
VAQQQMNLLEITNLIILVHLMVESKEVWSVETINFIKELVVLQDLILPSKLNNNRDLLEAESQEMGVNISSIIRVILLTPQIENCKVSHLFWFLSFWNLITFSHSVLSIKINLF